ncbi:uncharacterized [Tachysurus ichikawai]
MIDRLELKVLHSSTKSDAVTPRHFVDSFMVSSRHPFQHFEACRGKRDRGQTAEAQELTVSVRVNRAAVNRPHVVLRQVRVGGRISVSAYRRRLVLTLPQSAALADGDGMCNGAAPTTVSTGNKVPSPGRLHVSCISTAFQLPFLARGGHQQDQRAEMLRLDASHMPARSMTLRFSQHLEYISMAVNGSQ